MQDHKMAAAGDIENLGQSESVGSLKSLTLESGQNLALALEVISHLERKLLTSLQEDQREQWARQLSRLSDRRLMKIANDFVGPFLSELWSFIDKLPNDPDPKPAYLNQLPEPKSRLSKDFFSHVRSLDEIQFKPTVKYEDNPEAYKSQRAEWLKEHRKHEKASLEKLHEKYPRVGFDRCLSDPRFAGL